MHERAGEVTELSEETAPMVVDAAGYRRIWDIAWPVSISTSTVTLLTLANLFWIGHLGTAAVAAVSLCGNLLFIVFGIASVVQTGALAIIARRVGSASAVCAPASRARPLTCGGGTGLTERVLDRLGSRAP